MILVQPPVREQDDYGAGHWNAPRGSRTHRGVDYACWPDSVLLSPLSGFVSRLGFPYASGVGNPSDSNPFRYVEVTDSDGLRHRFFYVLPIVGLGQAVASGDQLGRVQDIRRRYPAQEGRQAITPHTHYEIIDADGNYLEPPG